MNARYRKIFAVIALVAALLLLFFELRRFEDEGGEVWFWLVIGGLTAFLALLELISRSGKK